MNHADRELLERIDQELRDALRIAPSPEFLPRVRTRLAEEPRRPALLVRWVLLAGAAAAALMFALRPPTREVLPGSRETRVAMLPPRSTLNSGSQHPPRLTADATRPPVPARPRASRIVLRESTVLVPRSERVAFERFIAGLDRWTFQGTVLTGVPALPAEDRVVIAPLEIPPMSAIDEQ